MVGFRTCAAALAALVLLGACGREPRGLDRVGRPVDSAQFNGPEARIKVDLPGAKDNVKLVRLRDGSIGYVIKRLGAGTDRLLTPEEFSEFVYTTRSGSGWMESLLNITSPAGIAWVTVGLLGQLVFTGRMLVQWIASERSQRSVIPVAFWWMSLGGAVMLVTYFVWRRDIVGVVGQATGLFIYARNLVLIRKSRGA
jgi:lipid-A-disaccharide synthase-like uncharacterized protein